jgi:hypothetical protein
MDEDPIDKLTSMMNVVETLTKTQSESGGECK